MTADHQIHPLHLGSLQGIPAATGAYGSRSKDTLDLPMYAYAIEDQGSGDLTLFDLGCCPPERAVERNKPAVRDYRTAPQALREAGLDPDRVKRVVLSHLHWDHSFGMHELPSAEFLVQREEVRFAFAPDPEQWAPYDAWEAGGRADWLDHLDRIRPLDGVTRLADGMHIVPMPGHTPGSQGLVVASGEQTYAMCGDLIVTYENWLGYGGSGVPIPPGIHSSLRDWRRTMDDVERYDWVLLPAHDIRVPQVLAGEFQPRRDV